MIVFLFPLSSLISGCRELAGKEEGSRSLSSVSCGGGLSPLNPPSLVPRFLRENPASPRQFFNRVSVRSQTFSVGDEFHVQFDHQCLKQKKNRGLIAQNIGNLIYSQSRLYAYNWKLKKKLSLQELKSMVKSEPCITELDYQHKAKAFYTSNDTYMYAINYFDLIQAEEAHDIFYHATTGIDNTVVIAVIDSGVDTDHIDLVNRMWTNTGEIPGNATDDDGNGFVDDVYGYNFASSTGDPNAEAWSGGDAGGEDHGTHVAGLAAAEANNSEGFAGVIGFNAQIMALNVFGSSPTTNATLVSNAIQYAIDHGADVINLSLGGSGISPTYESALQSAVDAGVTVLIAAGNSSLNLDNTWVSPGNYGAGIDGVINVGSMDAYSKVISSFSNYSPTYVEIIAPGSDSNRSGLGSTTLNDGYTFKSGTSMASPVAAGATALAIGLLRARGGSTSPAAIENLVTGSGAVRNSLSGYGKESRELNLLNLAETINFQCPP